MKKRIYIGIIAVLVIGFVVIAHELFLAIISFGFLIFNQLPSPAKGTFFWILGISVIGFFVLLKYAYKVRNSSFLIAAIVMVGLVFIINSIFGCHLSDKQAVTLARDFCSKLGIICSEEPQVLGSHFNSYGLMLNTKVKEVSFDDVTMRISVNCSNREVAGCLNQDIERQIRRKYRISYSKSEPHTWPPFLSEDKAKEMIFSIAEKIGLPQGAEFSRMTLNEERGLWAGYWIRKHNGFRYDRDSIGISIMAVDGEFVSYHKSFLGMPCPTDVRLTKEEAIEAGWKQVEKYLGTERWTKYRSAFEVKSADLLIVHPTIWEGMVVPPWYSTKSRLAWHIVYGLKSRDDRMRIAVGFKTRMTLEIDAATKKFLSVHGIFER